MLNRLRDFSCPFPASHSSLYSRSTSLHVACFFIAWQFCSAILQGQLCTHLPQSSPYHSCLQQSHSCKPEANRTALKLVYNTTQPREAFGNLSSLDMFGSDDCAGMINKYKYYICLWVMFKNVFFSLSFSILFLSIQHHERRISTVSVKYLIQITLYAFLPIYFRFS